MGDEEERFDDVVRAYYLAVYSVVWSADALAGDLVARWALWMVCWLVVQMADG